MLIEDDRIYMTVPYAQRYKAKMMVEYRWHNDKKQWSWPLDLVEDVIKIFPASAPVLQKYLDIKKNIEKVFVIEDWREKYKFKLKPFLHQYNMIEQLLYNKQYALFCEMGTGKSKPIIDTFGILREKKEVKHCLIVCPKTVMENWIGEIKKNSDFSYVIVTGDRKKCLTQDHDFYIINYEGIRAEKNTKLFDKINMAVLDESHKIKNHQAKQTKQILSIFANKDIRKYLLSGTPISQSLMDIFSQFKFLNQSFLKFSSYYSCRNYYCIMGGYGDYQIVGYNNEEELKKRIADHSLQLKKQDCIDLPDKVYEKVFFDMSTEMKKQYESMRKDLIIELEDKSVTASISLVKILRLQEILSGHYLADDKDNEKLKGLKEILEENPKKQIIIWCHYIKTVKMLESLLQKLNLNYSIVYGAIKNRQEQQDNFNSGKNTIFIGQIATGGLGINLTAANMVIYFENEYSMTNRIQSEDRAHRYGQKNQVTYIDMLYRKTIDEIVLAAIQKKEVTATFLIDSFKRGER